MSLFHHAVAIVSGHEAIALALPAEHIPCASRLSPPQLAQRLLALAARLKPKPLTSSKRAPKPKVPKGYVDGSTARAHVTTAREPKARKVTP